MTDWADAGILVVGVGLLCIVATAWPLPAWARLGVGLVAVGAVVTWAAAHRWL